MTAAQHQARLALVAQLRRQGLSVATIADRLQLSAGTIYAEMVALRRGELRPPPAGRPAWSVPDRLLLAEAHDARREIEQREGFRRPPA
jgi:transposase